MDMLEQAVEALKSGKEPSLDHLLSQQTEIELRIPALLPEDYIPDVSMRLSFYKKLASAKSEQELDEVQVELIDRFGLLPDASKNLVTVSTFKLQAQTLGIKRIEASAKGGTLEFMEQTRVAPSYIIELIQTKSREFKLEGGQKLRFTADLTDSQARLSYIQQLLHNFASHQTEHA